MKLFLLNLLFILGLCNCLQNNSCINYCGIFFQDCNFPIPAKFPGGNKAWAKYLQKNTNSALGNTYITIPKNKRSAQVTVHIDFVISKWGYVTDVERATTDTIKVHPKLLAEAIRVIKTSPRWVAESMYGKRVTSRKCQAITWQVSKE